jgi:hypothetical protein
MRLSSAVLALMPGPVISLLFALLVVGVPFTSILRIMLQLPRPLALSHRKWPMPLNIALIGVVTAVVAVFIYFAYYRGEANQAAMLMQFLIVAVAYIFGLVLLQRQFAGVYPEYIIVSGALGLTIRKIAYRNIQNVEQLSQSHGETRIRIHTNYGIPTFTLPTRYVSIFYNQLRISNSPPL